MIQKALPFMSFAPLFEAWEKKVLFEGEPLA
jgi:hypothetical protein